MNYEVSLTNGTETLDLLPANGIVLQRFNMGYPTARIVSSRRNGINGSLDLTKQFGDRTITASVGIAPELKGELGDINIMDDINRWMSPDQRYYLVVKNRDAPARRYRVRPNSSSANFNGESAAAFTEPTLQWIAYEGVAEGVVLKTDVVLSSAASELGRAYNLTFDRTYPASAPLGERIIYNAGNAPAWPIIRFYGPVTGAELYNVTTNQTFKMKNSYSISAGQFIQVNMREGTVLLDGNPANTRYFEIDFPVNEWWQVQPGNNQLRFRVNTSSAPAQAQIDWYDTYL